MYPIQGSDYITFTNNGSIILTEAKDTLIYEYGIARCKQSDFDSLDKAEYISYRKRGLQLEVLVSNKTKFRKKHLNIIMDNATIDEILPLITQQDN